MLHASSWEARRQIRFTQIHIGSTVRAALTHAQRQPVASERFERLAGRSKEGGGLKLSVGERLRSDALKSETLNDPSQNRKRAGASSSPQAPRTR